MLARRARRCDHRAMGKRSDEWLAKAQASKAKRAEKGAEAREELKQIRDDFREKTAEFKDNVTSVNAAGKAEREQIAADHDATKEQLADDWSDKKDELRADRADRKLGGWGRKRGD